MKLHNPWSNYEADLFLDFFCSLDFPIDTYQDKVFELNKSLHQLTHKHEFLMTLSPEYCSYYDIGYLHHYEAFLSKNISNPSILPIDGYEFYQQKPSRISKIFFNDDTGEGDHAYVHYLLNGLNGRMQAIINKPTTRDDQSIYKHFYDASPISLSTPKIVIGAPSSKTVNVRFGIESHSSIWLDTPPDFKYINENNEERWTENIQNSRIAYKNTPRLNSFLRDVKALVIEHGGYCLLYDYESLTAHNQNNNSMQEAREREGLSLNGQIIYQEDIDSGKVKLPEA